MATTADSCAARQVGSPVILSLRGKDKIITCVSGEYGFGDDSELGVKFYDPDGLHIPGRSLAVRATEHGSLDTVKLREGEMAIVFRRR